MEVLSQVKGETASITVSDGSINPLRVVVAPLRTGRAWSLTVQVPVGPPVEILPDRNSRESLFLNECCVYRPGDRRYAVKPSVLYQTYLRWFKDGRTPALGRNHFYSQVLLIAPGVLRRQLGPKKLDHFVGLQLKPGIEAFNGRRPEFKKPA